MLSAVKWMFENDYRIEDTDKLVEAFNKYKDIGGEAFNNLSASDFMSKENFTEVVQNILKTNNIT
jgi:hypothetical protein